MQFFWSLIIFSSIVNYQMFSVCHDVCLSLRCLGKLVGICRSKEYIKLRKGRVIFTVYTDCGKPESWNLYFNRGMSWKIKVSENKIGHFTFVSRMKMETLLNIRLDLSIHPSTYLPFYLPTPGVTIFLPIYLPTYLST